MSKIIKEDPSWVTKYNGFNNGKDASDGVGGRRIPLQIKTMSKTKEEILLCKNPQLDNTIEFYSQSLVVRDVIKAMDEYAQQAVQEYKEKLKAEIRCIVASEGNGKYTLNKALSIIEQP